jgi:D-aminopeptidase
VADSNAPMHSVETIPNDRLDPLFDAVVQAIEEAVVNALVDQNADAASSRVWQTEKATASRFYLGRDDHRVEALPHERLIKLLKTYGRFH